MSGRRWRSGRALQGSQQRVTRSSRMCRRLAHGKAAEVGLRDPLSNMANALVSRIPCETNHGETNHAMRIFADFDPPQTFALRADEILGNERQTVEMRASAAGVASACNSISHPDHAASGAATPT